MRTFELSPAKYIRALSTTASQMYCIPLSRFSKRSLLSFFKKKQKPQGEVVGLDFGIYALVFAWNEILDEVKPKNLKNLKKYETWLRTKPVTLSLFPRNFTKELLVKSQSLDLTVQLVCERPSRTATNWKGFYPAVVDKEYFLHTFSGESAPER